MVKHGRDCGRTRQRLWQNTTETVVEHDRDCGRTNDVEHDEAVDDALGACEEVDAVGGGEGGGEEEKDEEGRVGADVVDELHERASQHLAHLQGEMHPSQSRFQGFTEFFAPGC